MDPETTIIETSLVDEPSDGQDQEKSLYLVRQNGRIYSPVPVTSGPSKDAPSPDTTGSVSWFATQLFGGSEEMVSMLESILGRESDPRWLAFCATWRQWRLDHQAGRLDSEPTLNQVAHRLKLNARELIAYVSSSIIELNKLMALTKASMYSEQVLDTSRIAALDPTNGFRDRELILKLAGVLQMEKGVQVNVNQQVGVRVDGQGAAPLKQFVETHNAIDENIRED